MSSKGDPDLIDDGYHRFVLVEITKEDRDWRVVERFLRHPELTDQVEGVKSIRAALRVMQQDMNRQLRFIVSPRIKSKIEMWMSDIDQLLVLRKRRK